MALTLVEAAKQEEDVFKRGVIATFIDNMRITQIVPFRGISGDLDGILQEEVLPNAATRGVNEAFVRSEGKFSEIVVALKIYGGDIGIDPFILETKGADQASRHVGLKIKAISNRWVTDFFKGDSGADARDFDGLQIRLDGFNVESAGNSSGGDPLSLAVLDEAIAKCHSSSVLFMGRKMGIRLTQAARDSLLTGSVIRTDKNEFGRPVTFYNDHEIVVVTDNSANDNILGFTEAATGGGSIASSIYVAGLGDEGIEGVQNGGFRVRGLGEDNSAPRIDTRVEWYNNFHINHQRSVIRVRDISDAPMIS